MIVRKLCIFSHLVSEGKDTKNDLTEASGIFLFEPHSCL